MRYVLPTRVEILEFRIAIGIGRGSPLSELDTDASSSSAGIPFSGHGVYMKYAMPVLHLNTRSTCPACSYIRNIPRRMHTAWPHRVAIKCNYFKYEGERTRYKNRNRYVCARARERERERERDMRRGTEMKEREGRTRQRTHTRVQRCGLR
jgi:hypothetical protein